MRISLRLGFLTLVMASTIGCDRVTKHPSRSWASLRSMKGTIPFRRRRRGIEMCSCSSEALSVLVSPVA